MAGCCRRASAFASWRNRAIMPGVHAISGCRTLQASRRSRSLSHSSYTSANPPRPTSRRTSYFVPSARARRCAVGTPAKAAAGAAPVGSRATRSFVITVGDGVPHDGQNAEPVGISARQEEHVIGVGTATKICSPCASCNGGAMERRSMLRSRINLSRMLLRVVLGIAIGYALVALLAWLLQERLAFPAPRAPVPDPRQLGIAHGERIELVSTDGTRLVGWYLAAKTGFYWEGRGRTRKVDAASPVFPRPTPSSPALLWFYGNGENVATLYTVLRD